MPLDATRPDPRPQAPHGAPPTVSIVVANYNGAAFLDAALRSARNQTVREIEIIVVDDASTDDSVAVAQAHAAQDGRVRVLAGGRNAGPAAARNRALDVAAGAWIAVFDSDDLMHPARLERLLAAAARLDADIVADDMLVFDDSGGTPPAAMLPWRRPVRVDLARYVRSNALYGHSPALGYLKPLIRAARLRDAGLRYDESLRIAEDYDLIAKLLLHGAAFYTVPDLTYFYRRHGASISHRLSRATLEPMLAAHRAFGAAAGAPSAAMQAALAARSRSIETAIAFEDLVAAVKRRNWAGMLAIGRRAPAAVALLRLPVLARLRRAPRTAPVPAATPGAVVLSRQRLVGPINGSSAYLLSLCGSLAGSGVAMHLVAPSPAVFGRWPVLALQREMDVFASIHVRGGLLVGRFIFATNPRIAAMAALTMLERLAGRLRLGIRPRIKPAPYAVAVPWLREDLLYVARHARAHADVIIADYAFVTEGLPYALRPDSGSCVIMHDLFSSRAAQFDGPGAQDTVAALELDEEMAMLGRAGAVVAIQASEAEIVRRQLPDHPVIVAPMATTPAAAAQPGVDGQILFVGSNTAPNVVGLRWFLDKAWPEIRAAVPDAVLRVAGSVGAAFGSPPDGAVFLGRVDDLGPLYRDAAVVISPLLQGSGLKIKLIEAAGHGKAIVATGRTLQGVEAMLGDAVSVADDAGAFAAAVRRLLQDPAARRVRGEAALAAARDAFSAARCYAGFNAFVAQEAGASAASRATNRSASARPATNSVTGISASEAAAEAYPAAFSASK